MAAAAPAGASPDRLGRQDDVLRALSVGARLVGHSSAAAPALGGSLFELGLVDAQALTTLRRDHALALVLVEPEHQSAHRVAASRFGGAPELAPVKLQGSSRF